MNIGNPYSFLVSTIRNQGAVNNSPSVELGKIVSAAPLTVTIGDLQLTSSNLLLADYLKEGYERTLEVSGTENVYTAKSNLNNNDTVALIKISDSSFLILCKVVEA
ncbi:DUF2577 family protein [Clostridium hydrogenum]|uniref:DUF2577 family protein n=1 Tax=Clostridium hydrogenum TaxID=2855764 RepID=UPI002E30DDE7|nr:DUF2577 family protein [Clostridium hydrogenum]